MHSATQFGLFDELTKISEKKIKSNDRMPARTKANILGLSAQVKSLEGPHREQAVKFMEDVGPEKLFEMLHSMRRWYSGQTMARAILTHRESLSEAMKLDPADVIGIFRGFKVPKDHELASAQVGQKLEIPVTRNHGFSSWSTTEAPTNRFSGGGKGKVGLIVKLVDSKGVTPVLAPPTHTEPWFNELYLKTIGKSFRPTEGEYLIAAPKINVEVVRVKR